MTLRALVDKLIGNTGSGYTPMQPSGWKTRIRETFVMTSPGLDTFAPKWAGDDRNKEKLLGMFNYARVKGTVVQDFGERSVVYPLTLYFDGPDHDQESERFWDACSQTGTWDVMHPTKGFKGLQLVRVSEGIQPVTSGNVTQFVTEWIEPIDPVTLKTVAQMASEAGMRLNDFNDAAATEFNAKVKTGTLKDRTSIIGAANTVTQAMDKILGPISEGVTGINEAFDATLRGVQDVLRATILEPLALASQIQQLTQLPMLATQDVKARLNAYRDLCREIFGMEARDTNTAAVREVSLNAVIGGMSSIATSSDATTSFKTKAQVIGAIESIDEQYTEIIGALDADATKFYGARYQSQVSTFTPGLLLTGLGVRYLLDAFYDLRIEKVFYLSVPSTPIRLAIENYGNAEQGLDTIIDTNELTGDELIWLPAGKRIVVYA
jgi:hypothetical protein